MHRIILLIICFIASTQMYSQKIKAKDVPPKVLNGLTKHFPNSKKESWEFIDSQYVVQFEVFGKKVTRLLLKKVASLIQRSKSPKMIYPSVLDTISRKIMTMKKSK